VSEYRQLAKARCAPRRLPQPGRIACELLCAGLFLTAGYAAQAQKPVAAGGSESAYEDGRVVQFTPVIARHGKTLVVGDLRLGRALADPTPNDHRPNVYVVCPGTRTEDGKPGEDFSLILSTLPRTEAPIEWDVYWVVVLDPAMPVKLTGEGDLLMAAQKAFTPDRDFDFANIPGAALLRKQMHIESRKGLGPYEIAGGDLPRLIIVPAHVAIRASAVAPATSPPPPPPPLSPHLEAPPQSSPRSAGPAGESAK